MLFIGDDCAERLLGQSAVAYHAAVRAADAACFADGKRGEVIVQHKALLTILHLDTVYNLRGLRSAERERAEHVRRTAIKEPRAVDHRRDAAGFGVERADFIHRAAVDTLSLFDCKVVHVCVQSMFEVGVELARFDIRKLRRRMRRPLFFKRPKVFLFEQSVLCFDERHDNLLEYRLETTVIFKWRHELGFFDATLFNYFFLPSLNLFNLSRCAHERSLEHILAHLARADLYHIDESVLSAGSQVHFCPRWQVFVALAVGRVDNIVWSSFLKPQAHGRNRSVPRDVRGRER